MSMSEVITAMGTLVTIASAATAAVLFIMRSLSTKKKLGRRELGIVGIIVSITIVIVVGLSVAVPILVPPKPQSLTRNGLAPITNNGNGNVTNNGNGNTTTNGNGNSTNNGTIYIVLNGNLPQPTTTPTQSPATTQDTTQNPYAQDMSTQVFNTSLQDNTNSNVQWEESDITQNSGRSVCTFYNQYYHAYDADPNKASYTSCQAQQTNVTNFTFEVQMIGVQGYAGGFFFRSQNSTQFAYLFLVRSDGLYGLYTVLNTTSGPYFKGIVGGTLSNFNTGTGQINTLAVVARDSEINIYVDLVGIASIQDSTYSQGGIGVVAWTNSDVVYRNAKLWTA